MIITKLNYRPFRLRFKSRFGTAQTTLIDRKGFIIKLETDNGYVGYGEASPLPEFGGGNIEDLNRLWPQWSETLLDCPVEGALDRLPSDGGAGTSALLCGFDTALCDLESQEKGIPLACLLSEGRIASEVTVNVTIGASSVKEASLQARAAVSSGFNTVKLKVGMASCLQNEVERVAAVRDAVGKSIKLRLDANGVWSVKTAIEILTALEKFEIELIEQPVRAEDLAGLAAVKAAVEIPIGADEAVKSISDVQEIISKNAADVLVVKPMVVGGLRVGRRIIELSEQAGLKVFVTTTIDSGIGIVAALHLAATLSDTSIACGLATGDLLERTLVDRLPPAKRGRMKLPSGPGLGVMPSSDLPLY